MRRALLVVSLSAALVAPAEARAAVASLAYEAPIPGVEPNPAYALSVRGDSEEINLLTVQHDGAAYTVRDESAPVAAGAGCAPVTPRVVRCSTPESPASHSVFVDAGDAADYVKVEALPAGATVELRGGRGADYLVGTNEPDVVFGGSGPDHVNGRGGDDMVDGGTGADSIDAGAGRDRLSYAARHERVRVDLRTGVGGSKDEGDRFVNIEEVVGGRGRDVLTGDAGPNRLLGGPGPRRDRIVGHRGDDVLVGYRVRGGPGDDSIDAQVEACGRDTDRLTRVAFKPAGPFPRNCETIVAGTFLELAPDPVLLKRTAAVYRLRCVAAIGRCAGTLVLRDSDGRLGHAGFSRGDAVAGDPVRVTIPLRRPASGRVGTVRLRAQPAYRRDRFRTRLR